MEKSPDELRRYLLNGANNIDQWPIELQVEFIAFLVENIEINKMMKAAHLNGKIPARNKIPLLGTIRQASKF